MYYISSLISTFNLCLQIDNRIKEHSWLGLRFTSALSHRSLPCWGRHFPYCNRSNTSSPSATQTCNTVMLRGRRVSIAQTRPAPLQFMLVMITVVIGLGFCDFRRNYRIKWAQNPQSAHFDCRNSTESIENVLNSMGSAEKILLVILNFFEADNWIYAESFIVTAEKIP